MLSGNIRRARHPGVASSLVSPLLRLPDELLIEIASKLLIKHHGQVVDASRLAIFSMVCRKIRHVTASTLFRDIPISYELQLFALARVPVHLLFCIRQVPFSRLNLVELTIYLDATFLQAWKGQSDIASFDRNDLHTPRVFLPFARLLSRTPSLRSLNFRVAETIGLASAWRKFPIVRSGLSFGRWLSSALEMHILSLPHDFSLSHLTKLHIDCFQDLGPLLKLCPNLRELTVCNSGGFDMDVARQLVKDLEYVPQVTAFSFTPESLLLEETEEVESMDNVDTTALLKSIGSVLPRVEHLSLQTRWFGYGVFFISCSVNPLDLLEAVSSFSNLKHLYTPINFISAEELGLFDFRRPPINAVDAELKRAARCSAIEDASAREYQTITDIRRRLPSLQSLAWVRFAGSNERRQSSVEYHFDPDGVPENEADSRTHGQPLSHALFDVSARAAEEGLDDPWPLVDPAIHVPMRSVTDVESHAEARKFGTRHTMENTLYWAGGLAAVIFFAFIVPEPGRFAQIPVVSL